MADVRIYSIPNCPNCKHLKMLLDRAGVQYAYRMFDPLDDNDVAEMAMMGIYNAQFPVVYLGDERLPAMTVGEYVQRIVG